MAVFLYKVSYPFQQGIMCHIQVTDSFGILLCFHKTINIQTCAKHQLSFCVALAFDKTAILLANGAIRVLVNHIFK